MTWSRPRQALLLLLAGALVTAGCDGGGREVSTAPESGASVPELTIAWPADEGPLNLFAQHEEALTELVYDKLLAPSPYVDDPQPWLARSVEQVDARTWDVALRDDVRWQDGEPFTAADVAFTIDLFKRAPAGRWTHHVTDTPQVASVDVSSDTQLRIVCASACPFLGTVTLADLPILPRHVWQDVDEPRSVTELPIGTGPYRLVQYDQGRGYVLEANADYFAGAPLVDRLVLPIVTDPSTAFTALRTGEVDAVADLVPPELVEGFRADPQITVVDTTPLTFPELRINYERPPFDRAQTRAAMSAAVDRQELLDTVWLGEGRPATHGYMHPDGAWSAPGVGWTHDTGLARTLLDGAGLVDRDGDGVRDADGGPVAFTIDVAGNRPTWIRAAEVLADQFAEVGLDATVQRFDPGSISALFRSRDFDTYITAAPTHGVADPTQFVMSQESGYLWRLPSVPYPEMAELIDQWRAAETIQERTGALDAMQALFAEQPTTIPLYYPDGPMAYRPSAFDGWVESPGYGLVHKWSLLPRSVADDAHALVGSAS